MARTVVRAAHKRPQRLGHVVLKVADLRWRRTVCEQDCKLRSCLEHREREAQLQANPAVRNAVPTAGNSCARPAPPACLLRPPSMAAAVERQNILQRKRRPERPWARLPPPFEAGAVHGRPYRFEGARLGLQSGSSVRSGS